MSQGADDDGKMLGLFSKSSRPQWPSKLTWIIGFGLAARVYHYLRDPGVWMDELFLLRNVVSKDYAELAGPLTCEQAAPPLFLWLERTVFLLLGDSAMALRLVPLVVSCAALLLLLTVARRCLTASAIPVAMLLFACSDKLVDHTVEAKQYLMDVFAAVLVPALYFATRDRRLSHRLIAFAMLAPLVLFASYPASFAVGALLVAVLPEVWAERRSPLIWGCYVLFAIATGAAFIALLIGPIRAQHSPELAAMWTDSFPDWSRPWSIPWWTLMAFANGVEHSFRPVGMVFAPAAVVGSIVLWRRGLKAETVLLGLPTVLGIVAAWLHACPYDSRVTLYTTGALSLFAGEGAIAFWQRLREQLAAEKSNDFRRVLWKSLACISVVLLLLPLGLTALHIVHPWPRQAFPWPEYTSVQQ